MMDVISSQSVSQDFPPMGEFTTAELEAAQQAIRSTIRKSEKVQVTLSQKQSPRTSQMALVAQRLKVLNTASSLIASALGEDARNDYSREDLEEARRTIPALTQQIETVKPKFGEETPQHTLAIRRIRAFQIASALIESELGS